MTEVIMYSTNVCPYCVRAKQLLDSKGVSYTEYKIDSDPAKREEMMSLTQRRTVPQIIINGEAIGGFDDLHALNQAGKLDELLNS
jgi:glutaredoxin 3